MVLDMAKLTMFAKAGVSRQMARSNGTMTHANTLSPHSCLHDCNNYNTSDGKPV